MRKIAFLAALTASVSTFAAPAFAGVTVLNFEGLSNYGDTFTQINDFYNGGTSAAGFTGPNYGISFSNTAYALCLTTPSNQSCSNTSRGGLGDPSSQKGGLIFLNGSQTYMNDAAGFDTGFSFNYSAPYQPGSVSVYSGLNGTGSLLATIALGTTQAANCDPAYTGGVGYCPFVAAGSSFAGIAKSISFAGTANYIVFDDVTFGSSTPGTSAVPEPASWAMMLAGFGMVGAAARRSRKSAAAAVA